MAGMEGDIVAAVILTWLLMAVLVGTAVRDWLDELARDPDDL